MLLEEKQKYDITQTQPGSSFNNFQPSNKKILVSTTLNLLFEAQSQTKRDV